MLEYSTSQDVPSWGFGRDCIGGQLGDRYKVTTLADNGDGSLRHGIDSAPGARLIEFDVEGTIELKSNLEIRKSYISVIGPKVGRGITLAKQPLHLMETEHVELRNLRFRLGDESGEKDCCEVYKCRNVMIDRCSFAWSVDECVSITSSHLCTLQRCIVAYSLYDSKHQKGPHALAGIYSGQVSLIGNLFAHHDFRPVIRGDIQLVGNIFYNYFSSDPVIIGEFDGARIDIASNVFKCGPSTQNRDLNAFRALRVIDKSCSIWLEDDNYIQLDDDQRHPPEVRKKFDFASPKVPHHAAIRFLDPIPRVLMAAGCPCSDGLDRRVLQDVLMGEGKIINSPADVGGFDAL